MIGGYYSSWGEGEARRRRVTLCRCLGRRERRKEEKTWPRQRGEKEAKRERESGVVPVEAEGCIHPYPSRGGYWGFDYLF